MSTVSNLTDALEAYMASNNGDRPELWKHVVYAADYLLRDMTDPAARDLDRLLRDVHEGRRTDSRVLNDIAFVAMMIGKDTTEHDCTSSPFIDWASFWKKDRSQAEWLFEDVLARGRGHSIYAGHKVGKSLLTLFIVLWLIAHGIVVIYLDYEMGEDDLYERLEDMGCGADSDLSLLRYALLPSLPPLDTAAGAKELHALVDSVQADNLERHVAVIIDTTGRAVSGEENSADTIRSFYRHTGLGLKQRGVTWARLDHAGKDATKGQRGSSAKGDDVDVVWRLARTDNGLQLHREATRMGWVPERVTFQELTDPYLRFVPVTDAYPAGTSEVARLLEQLGIAPNIGERPAGQALRNAGHKAGQHLVRAAQKYRRKTAEEGVK